MKILVTDDMPSMRHVMMHMLRSLGYQDIDEAVDGAQAFTMLAKKEYDLLITDLNMPKLDGKSLLKKIREHKTLKNLPVLMVTCEDDSNKVKEIIASKVDGFIIKPFNLRTLKTQLQKMSFSEQDTIQLDC